MCVLCSKLLPIHYDGNRDAVFLWLPAVNRILALTKGYLDLVRCLGNYAAAIHLIRPILDSGIRFAAILIVEDREAFIDHIIKKDSIRNYKNQGQKLTDKYIVDELKTCIKADGVVDPITLRELYDELCSVIHYSDKHISMIKDVHKNINPQTGELPFRISNDGNVLNDKDKLRYHKYLLCSLWFIYIWFNDWLQERNNLHQTATP